ncbi:MAG: arylesterase [Candidatus Competibacterales bacterium]
MARVAPSPPPTRFGSYLQALMAALVLGWVSSAALADPIRLLALGDSLTAGYGLARGDSLPAQLETALGSRGYDVVILNAGVSGDTTAGGRARLAWALGDDPDGVIVALGANDGLRGIDPATTRANLKAILEALAARNLPVLLAGMYAPPNLGKGYETPFNALYRDLAADFDVVFYPFILEGVATEAALNQTDGIHPNAEGVAAIVERLLPYVERLLARIDA